MSVSQDLCLYVCLYNVKSKSNVSYVTITNFYKVISYIGILFLHYDGGDESDVFDVEIPWGPLGVMLYVVIQ